MTVTSAFAPYNISIGNYGSYITTTEYQNAPTAMDLNNLLAGANPLAQLQALQETIYRASSWIDNYVTGNAYGTLNATSNTENARVWGSYRNTLIVKPMYWPVLEVQTFSYSALASGLASGNATSITPAGNITVYPQQFEVSPAGVVGLGLNAPGGILRGYEYTCQWTYINGFPNTTLSASVAAGASVATVASGLGIYPGSQLTLFDLPNDENVALSTTAYTADSATLTFSSPLQYSHQAGAVLTNLPKSVKQAAILLTTALIKQRGSGAMIIEDMGASTKIDDGLTQGEDADVGIAFELLHSLKQMYLGY